MRSLCIFLAIASIFFACTNDDGVVETATMPSWENLTTRDGLLSNEIYMLYEDSDSNIWMGSAGGISLYDGERFRSFGQFNNLIGYVEAITQGPDGAIWVGSGNGLGIYEFGEWSYIRNIEGYEIGVISLYTIKNGGILIGTTNLGVLTYDESGFLQVFDNSCNECNFARAFLEDSDGNLWIGTDGGLKRFTSRSSNLFTNQGLSENDIRSLSEDQWGRVWVGTLFGTSPLVFEGNSFSEIGMQNGIDFNPVETIAKDRFGNMWLGLIGGGIVRFDGAVMQVISDPAGPGVQTIYSIIERSNGDIWAGSGDDGLWIYSGNR